MKNFTKLLFYLAFMFLAVPGMFAQISIIEAMDGGVPSGWTNNGYFNSTLSPCEGTASVRDNLWSSAPTGSVETPTQTSNGTDITVSYEWQATPYTTNPVGFTTIVDYTIDGGTTYTQVGTYSATATTSCTPFSATILGADVPVGSSFNLRITANWDNGDSYHYIDNVSVTQVVSTPPNCDAALTSDLTDFPIDGTLTWSGATGIPTGYTISIGTTSGGTDIANNVDVMSATSYTPTGLMNGTTYYVTITPYNDNGMAMGCTEETFETVPPPPANDECTSPTVLSLSSSDACENAISGTTQYAMASSDGCSTTNRDVWYSFTPVTSGGYFFSAPESFDSGFSSTYVTVYDGSCGALTRLGTTCFSTSISDLMLTGGTTYLVNVRSTSSTGYTNFDVCVYAAPPPPANDDCAGAIDVPVEADEVCVGTIAGNTASASQSLAGCLGTADDDIWYSFVATGDEHIIQITNVTGSGTSDIVTQVFDGCGGTSLKCQDTPNSPITVTDLTAGNTYYFRIYSYSSTTRTSFTVCVGSPPPPLVVGCGTKFYDTGGPTGDYSAGENETWTICPDNAGEFVTVTFNTFETEGRGANNCWDALRIFDGNSNTAPEIGPGTGYCYQSATDGTNYPGIALGTPITSTDASGCLHFTFTSDGSGQYEGWDADVTCGPASSSCGSDAVILAAAPQTDLTPQCMEGGWLYYGDGTSTYFAIEPFPAGGNTNAFTADVDIFLGAAQQNTAAVCNGAPIDAYFEMGRAWNVDVLTGTIGGTVNCRFYYDAAELTALTTAVSTFESANSACTYSSGAEVWFKNTGAPYAHYSYDGTQATLATTPGTNGMGVDYREFPVTGFSGGSVGVISIPATVLPVELASFTGKTMSKTNMLEWVTASEENTEWHVIERSKDGRSNWTEVGRTEAKGFSNELISYELEDTKPMAKSYYRLRSVDFDGYEDLSNVIYLEREIEQFDIVKVYPVPTSKLLNIDFETVEDQQVQISMTDMLGKVITTRPVGAVAGINTATLDLGNLANGVYFVTINNGQNKITKRVVKN